MKKAKIFSAISLLMLCVCMLSFGIIAATSGNHNVGMGGTIQIPANAIGVEVKAYIIQGVPAENQEFNGVVPDYDSTLSNPQTDSEGKVITSCGETWEFTKEQLQKLTFNYGRVNVVEDLANVKVSIVFVIENKGELNLTTKFTLDKNSETSLELENLQAEDTVNGVTDNYDTVSVEFHNNQIASNSVGKCYMEFTPLRFVNQSKVITFDYTLNVIEDKQV